MNTSENLPAWLGLCWPEEGSAVSGWRLYWAQLGKSASSKNQRQQQRAESAWRGHWGVCFNIQVKSYLIRRHSLNIVPWKVLEGHLQENRVLVLFYAWKEVIKVFCFSSPLFIEVISMPAIEATSLLLELMVMLNDRTVVTTAKH